MKVKRMRMKYFLRRMWLLSANRIEPSESTIKPSQTRTHLIIVTDNCNIDVQRYFQCNFFLLVEYWLQFEKVFFIKFCWPNEKNFTPVTKLEVNGEKDRVGLWSLPQRDRLCGCVPGQKNHSQYNFKVALWWNFVQICRSFAVVNPRNRLNFPDEYLPVSLLFVGGKTGRNPALSTLLLVSTSPAKINVGIFLKQNISRKYFFMNRFPSLAWPKFLLFRTHHLWNSTTELILD